MGWPRSPMFSFIAALRHIPFLSRLLGPIQQVPALRQFPSQSEHRRTLLSVIHLDGDLEELPHVVQRLHAGDPHGQFSLW